MRPRKDLRSVLTPAMAALALAGWAPAQAPVTETASADDLQRTRARPARELDHHLLRTVHLDLLGRPPFQAEYEQWLGLSLQKLLDELIGSPAFWNHWLEEQLYYFLLIDNFRPDAERLERAVPSLAEGRLHARDAIHRIVLSPSFEMRNPGADTFVTVVMEQITGMKVQSHVRELEIGKKIYDGGRGVFLGSEGATQADVVRIAIESPRFRKHFVAREYERLVRGAPAKKELNEWARRLRKDEYVYPELVREWLMSDAYSERLETPVPSSNRLFVSMMHVDLLDRAPDPREVETLRNALDGLSDSMPLRSVVARLLLDSGTVPLPAKTEITDPKGWIGGMFRRWLGRDPTEREITAFVEAFADPACQPTTVVYAILSDPEYHRY